MIPINSIEIPGRFVFACEDWYSGAGDKLYAVSSTGGLTLGGRCPVGINDYTDRDDRNRRWYLQLWRNLSVDVGFAASSAEKGHNGPTDEEDAVVLREFEDWINDEILPKLAESYGLEDWAG